MVLVVCEVSDDSEVSEVPEVTEAPAWLEQEQGDGQVQG